MLHFLVLLLSVFTATAMAGKNYDKLFAYYNVDIDDLASQISYLDGINVFSAATVDDARRAAAVPRPVSSPPLRIFLLVEKTFFKGKGLHPEYKQRWAEIVANTTELVKSGALMGINIGDELVWNCIEPSAVIEASNTVRETFPRGGLRIWYNEAAMDLSRPTDMCGKTHYDYKIPEALDYFSIDRYHYDGVVENWVRDYIISYYNEQIYPKLTAEQKVLFIPGSFGSNVNHYPNGKFICDRECYDKMIAHDAYDFTHYVLADDRVAGMFPWNWGGCPGCNGSRWTPPHTCCMDEIGTKDMPLSRATWAKLVGS